MDSHRPRRGRPLDSGRQSDHCPPVGYREPPGSAALHIDPPLSARRTKHAKGAARNEDPAPSIGNAGRPGVGVNQHRSTERPTSRIVIVTLPIENQLQIKKRPLAGLQAHVDQPTRPALEVGRQVPRRTDCDLTRPWRVPPLADRFSQSSRPMLRSSLNQGRHGRQRGTSPSKSRTEPSPFTQATGGATIRNRHEARRSGTIGGSRRSERGPRSGRATEPWSKDAANTHAASASDTRSPKA